MLHGQVTVQEQESREAAREATKLPRLGMLWLFAGKPRIQNSHRDLMTLQVREIHRDLETDQWALQPKINKRQGTAYSIFLLHYILLVHRISYRVQ
jgi:hypothetical protein